MTVIRERPAATTHPPTRRRRTLLVGMFLVHLALLTWVVLWKLEVPTVGWGGRHLKLVPFVASDGDGASQPVEVLGNVLLFVPFGLYLSLLVPSWSRWRMAAAALGASAALEAAQFVLAVGRSDTTDVVANTAGAALGLGLASLARRRIGPRATRLTARACTVGTVVALAACATLAAGPIRYGPPDVRCDGQGPCRVGDDLTR